LCCKNSPDDGGRCTSRKEVDTSVHDEPLPLFTSQRSKDKRRIKRTTRRKMREKRGKTNDDREGRRRKKRKTSTR